MKRYRFGWKPDLPDVRDKVYQISYWRRFNFMLPSTVDLRPAMPPVYDQGDLGSCTGNAIAAAIQYANMVKGDVPFMPSRLMIYYLERSMEGTVNIDAGAAIRDGIKAVAKWGVCPESVWPYDVAKFTQRPSPVAYAQAKKELVTEYQRVPQTADYLRSILALKLPIVFGFSVYENMMTEAVDETGVVPMPKGATVGGHAILMVGFDHAKSQFIFRNSWGTGWGDKGYGYMPYEYVTDPNLSTDFWSIKSVT